MKNKLANAATPALLHPLPIPDGEWQEVSMDFVAGLPKPQEKDVIFVVVDWCSKYAHCTGHQHPYSAAQVAQAHMDSAYKLHGLANRVVSDRDIVFISKFWAALFETEGGAISFFQLIICKKFGGQQMFRVLSWVYDS